MKSNGALLPLGSVVVRTSFFGDDEVRYLYNHGVIPRLSNIVERNANLIKIPFDWTDFVENELTYP
jgi:hypothetical protein